jgi:phage major head subunit gpT-like protein
MDRLRFLALAQGHIRECFDGQNFFDDEHPQFDDRDTTWSNIDTTDAGEPWYLLDLSKPLKPLIDQERETPHFWWDNQLTSTKVSETGLMTAYGEARGAVGYTLPFLAYRSTKVLNAASYKAARDAMKAFKDDNGEPRGIRPTHLVAGISNQQLAKDTFKPNLTNGESNTLAGEVAIIEADRLP